jgi:hypothetical protein
MKNLEATHFMFIDNDITWSPIEIAKLLIANKDVIGGAYPLKSYKWDKILQSGNIMNDIKEKKKQNNVYNFFDNEAILKSQLLKFNMNVLSEQISIQIMLLKFAIYLLVLCY